MDKTAKSAILIFLLLCLAYLLTAKGFIEISDTHYSELTAGSLLKNLSFSINEYTGGYCLEGVGGRYYAKYGVGLAFILVPFVAAARIIAHMSAFPLGTATDLLVSFYNILFGAGLGVAFFYMLSRFFNVPLKISVAMALILGLATMQWRYSIWTFSETTQSFFLLLSIYMVLKNTKKSMAAASLSYAALILIRPGSLIYIPLFLIYIWARNKDAVKDAAIRAGLFLSFISAALCFNLFLNYLRFNNIFEFGYGAEAGMFYLSGIKKNIPKLLYYLDKGIFVYNPVLILSAVGYFKFFKDHQREALFFISIIVLNLAATSTWHMWYGGWCWGPRFLVPVIALWLVPLYIFISKKGLARRVAVIFILASLAVQLLSVLAGNLEYHLICNANGREGLRKGMPANITGAAILLKHKLLKNDNKYKLSEFGISSDTVVDTSGSECYRGSDFWYCYLGRIRKQP